MRRIGLLSDTHTFLHPKLTEVFSECDELWHAGDIGNLNTINKLSAIKPVKAVFGNIDDYSVRLSYPEVQVFTCEDVKVVMMHIGGYPGRYSPRGREVIRKENPNLFISGHSHILKVMYDKRNELLHINPGSAGINGLHKVITMVRFVIDGKDIRDLEVIELPRNGMFKFS
ncbi:MAG: metallophosphoesterase family protein [Bacteroidales bacterium]